MKTYRDAVAVLSLLALALAIPPSAHAVSTVFSYQGHVTVGGTNFNGTGQFKFALVISTNSSRQATGAPTMGGISPNMFVSSCSVIDHGSGYTAPAQVSFSGGGGTGASAVANVSGGMVTSITVITPGSGYSSPPTLTIDAPPPNISFTTFWSNDGTSINGSEPGSAVAVPVSGGLFTVILGDTTLANMAAVDAAVFGQPNLELRIWFNDGVHGFAALSPTQRLTPTPYAVTSGSASNLLGALSASQLTGTIPAAQLAGAYNGLISFNNGNDSFSGAFTGNGAGVTNLSATALTLVSSNTSVTAWGWNDFGQRLVPTNVVNPVSLAVGYAHSLAAKADGTVVAWGVGMTNNPANGRDYGQAVVPAGLSNVTAVAAGEFHSLALRRDGTVVAWGAGATNNPADQADCGQAIVPASLTNARAIAAGALHSLALRTDGTIVGWGAGKTNNPGDGVDYGQLIIPPGISNVLAISAGVYHNLLLLSNGTLLSFGNNDFAQTNVPAGLSNVIAIAAGGVHNLALKADGTVVAWGAGTTVNPTNGIDWGQSLVPPGLSNVVAISAGLYHSLALKADGTVVAWGDDTRGASSPPAGLNNVRLLAQGAIAQHALAGRRQSTAPVAWLDSDNTFNGNVQVNGQLGVWGEMSATDIRLNDGTLWLRGGVDQGSGLGWYGDSKFFNGFPSAGPDGPVLFGASGGALGAFPSSAPASVALVWDASQQVGIGTTTPAARLDLGPDGGNSKLLLCDSGGGVGLGGFNGQLLFNLGGQGGRFSFMASPAGTELVSIISSGNVGIGTTSPLNKLDVRGNITLGSTGQYQATGGQENLRIVRGVLNANGTTLAGSGFTPTHPSSGIYTVTFNPAFTGVPTITLTGESGGAVPIVATTDGVTASAATFKLFYSTTGNANDAPLHFIAIGPR